MDMKNKHLLNTVRDRISFLYIEKARIEQTDFSVQIIQGVTYTEIPITTIACLIFGPGVSITHRAVEIIAEAGCSICWMGTDGCKFYCYGEPATHHSKNILIQMKYHETTSLRMLIVRRMYGLRYPKEHLKSKTLESLRGIEGQHVKNMYEQLAAQYGIDWTGRECKVGNFEDLDDVNKNITMLNQYLYAIIEAVLVMMGFSPAIGYIHTGNMKSFVYDIADLYKEDIVFPLAFKLASEYGYDRNTLNTSFRNKIVEYELLKKIPKHLKDLFCEAENVCIIPEIDGQLWNYKNFINSGKNYSSEP